MAEREVLLTPGLTRPGARLRTGYIGMLIVAWLLTVAVALFPSTSGDTMQALWVRSWLWIAVLIACSAGARDRVWKWNDAWVNSLLVTAVATVLAGILFDYVLVVLLLQRSADQFTGWLADLSGLLYLGSLVGGLCALVALIRVERLENRVTEPR